MTGVLSTLSALNSIPITPDSVRFIVIFAFIYAAVLDHRTRRVRNEFWIPLIGLCFVVLGWDIGLMLFETGEVRSVYLYSLGLSVLIVPTLTFTMWQIGFFGGADVKAFAFLAVFFPQAPSIVVGGRVFPTVDGISPIFTLTVLFNAFVFAAGYQLLVTAKNIWKRDFASVMTNSTKYKTGELDEKHGTLIESEDSISDVNVDLDILRMYLQWRGTSLEELRTNPHFYRSTPPLVENEIGDGSVDSPEETPLGHSRAEFRSTLNDRPDGIIPIGAVESDSTDPWGAEKFVDAIDTDDQITFVTVSDLRDALDTITTQNKVWVMPAIPFFVPLTLGLIVALFYGSLLMGFTERLAALIVELFIL